MLTYIYNKTTFLNTFFSNPQQRIRANTLGISPLNSFIYHLVRFILQPLKYHLPLLIFIDLACDKGYKGQNCDVICPFPFHGMDCQSICNCTETSCDHVEGCRGLSTGICIWHLHCYRLIKITVKFVFEKYLQTLFKQKLLFFCILNNKFRNNKNTLAFFIVIQQKQSHLYLLGNNGFFLMFQIGCLSMCI